MQERFPSLALQPIKSLALSNLQQKLNNGTITKKNGNATQNLNAGLAVNWHIFDGFKMFATKQRLEELEKNGEYAFRKNMNETVYNVITSYYNIVTLNEQVKHSGTNKSYIKIGFFLAQRRFEIGTGAKFEVSGSSGRSECTTI